MASHRPKVPAAIKRALVDETGGQCANPGCASTVFEFHHIRQWAIYRTHDRDHMIALCPTCHANVTRGQLRLSDEMLYEWKTAVPDRWAAISVPPSAGHKLLLGSVSVLSPQPTKVFDFDTDQSLSFQLDATGKILSVNAEIYSNSKTPLLQMSQNTTTAIADAIQLEQRPGRVRALLDDWQNLLPLWAYKQLVAAHPGDVAHGIPLFDIQVLKPGLIKVSGIWPSKRSSVVITDSALVFLSRPDNPLPLSIVGEGEDTVLVLNGPDVLFGVASKARRSTDPEP